MASLLVISLAVAACGRKAPPRWIEYPPPGAPEALSALVRPDSVRLTWEHEYALAEEAGVYYVVERMTDGVYAEAARTDTRTAVFDGRGAYRVLACEAHRETCGPASGVIETSGEPLPRAPFGGEAKVRGAEVTFSWAHADGEAYNVYTTADAVAPVNPVPLGEPGYTAPALPDGEMSYLVRAAFVRGPVVHEGPASDPVSVGPGDYVPSAPGGLDAVLAEGGRAVLLWAGAPEPWVKGYRVYRSVDGGAFEPVGESRSTAYTDAVPEGALRVKYRVTALGPEAEGPASGAEEARRP